MAVLSKPSEAEDEPTVDECTVDLRTGEVYAGSLVGEAALLKPPRNRKRKTPLDPHHQAQIDARPCRVELPAFGAGKSFPNFRAFMDGFKAYAAEHFTHYRIRRSDSPEVANAALEKKRLKDGSPRDEAFDRTLIPTHFRYHNVTFACSRGCQQQSRAQGVDGANVCGQEGDAKAVPTAAEGNRQRTAKHKSRSVKKSAFTGCNAQIKAIVLQDPVTGDWRVVTKNEVIVHNHRCSQDTLNALSKSELLANENILEDVKGQLASGANASNICDSIRSRFGIRITPKMIANLKRDRLGGKSAIESLKLLLMRFSCFSGARALIINDQLGNICGIVIQSGAQREFMRRFDRNLVFDWTHNTNNLGFYLGSFMVTSVTGHGVSVVDFLCQDQTKATMTAVISWFKKKNPTAEGKVESVVIDKDYTEWAVLKEQFPRARILLCQFHAVKWFAEVIEQKKYCIPLDLRDKAFALLHSMVYAKTADGFAVLQDSLQSLLQQVSPRFLAYMSARWYHCTAMWSDFVRGSVFTALNTTTNRIESAWNQIKKVLGKKLRIDLCLEAIFAYQSAVIWREYKALNDFDSLVQLRSGADPFVRPALAELSDFAADATQAEWVSCCRHDVGTIDPYVAQRSTAMYEVSRSGSESAAYHVDPGSWTCSCSFSITSGLPCRHVLFVARRVFCMESFPVEALLLRWRMRAAADLISLLRGWGDQMQTLRTSLLLADRAFSHLIDPDYFEPDAEDLVRKRVAYFALHRYEESDVVVFNHMEKMGLLEREFSRLSKYLCSQSTPHFIAYLSELKRELRALLARWKEGIVRGPEEDANTATHQASENCDVANNEGDLAFDEDKEDCISEADFDEGDEVEDGAAVDISDAVIEIVAAEESRRVSARLQGCAASAPTPASGTKLPLVIGGVMFAGPSSTPMPHPTTPSPPSTTIAVASPAPTSSAPASASTDTRAPQNSSMAAIPFPADEFADEVVSVATTDVSDLIGPVARHELSGEARSSPTSGSSIAGSVSPSTLSMIMTAVLHYNTLSHTAAPGLQSPARRPAKRSAPPSSPDISSSDVDASSDEEDRKRLKESLSSMTFADRVSVGTNKKLKTSGKATGVRLGDSDQVSSCTVVIEDFSSAMVHTRGIEQVAGLVAQYPELLSAKSFNRMDVKVKLESFPRSSQFLNHTIPYSRVLDMSSAMDVARTINAKAHEMT